MGLFGKKDPCAICGNKVKALFPDGDFCYLPGEENEFAIITPLTENGVLEKTLKDIAVIKKIRTVGEDE